jgi:hypothetical protein
VRERVREKESLGEIERETEREREREYMERKAMEVPSNECFQWLTY